MQLVRQGDKLPAVTMIQKIMGARVDGNFGQGTRGKVASWQSTRPLRADGVVGRMTWNRMMQEKRFMTVDVVDADDPSLLQYEASDITTAGGSPIILQGMSNGVAVMVDRVLSRVRRAGTLALLRIHSHGAAGLMNVSAGHRSGSQDMAAISIDSIASTGPQMARLAPCFVKYGCIQLMGCNVGQGASGQRLLDRLASYVGVPASAGVPVQTGGGGTTFRFEGEVSHGFPYGEDLRQWSRMATI